MSGIIVRKFALEDHIEGEWRIVETVTRIVAICPRRDDAVGLLGLIDADERLRGPVSAAKDIPASPTPTRRVAAAIEV